MTNEERKLNEAIKQNGVDTQADILEELKNAVILNMSSNRIMSKKSREWQKCLA